MELVDTPLGVELYLRHNIVAAILHLMSAGPSPVVILLPSGGASLCCQKLFSAQAPAKVFVVTLSRMFLPIHKGLFVGTYKQGTPECHEWGTQR